MSSTYAEQCITWLKDSEADLSLNIIQEQIEIATNKLQDNPFHTKSTSVWGWGALVGITFGFPDVKEPLAGVTSDFPGFNAFTDDGNLQ